MIEVGAYEAKTHLPRLLERVLQGEKVLITKHGRPVAELVPVSDPGREETRRALSDLRRFQETHSLAGTPIRELIEEGRKY